MQAIIFFIKAILGMTVMQGRLVIKGGGKLKDLK